MSYKLVDLPTRLLDRLKEHLVIHRLHLAPVLRGGAVIRPLTPQPLREGAGERFPVVQLLGEDVAVLAAFRLSGAPDSTVVRPVDLDPDATYRLQLLGPGAEPADVSALRGGRVTESTGKDLMDGITLSANSGATSWLLELRPVGTRR
jgi:hypothetical protein